MKASVTCLILMHCSAHLPGVAEYTDCISAEGKTTSQPVSWYETKQSDDAASVFELWGMWSTPSLPLLPGPLKARVEVPDSVLSMSKLCANK